MAYYILIWLVYWYFVWGVYNYVLIPNGFSIKRNSYIAGMYFLISSLLPLYFIFGTYSLLVIPVYILFFLLKSFEEYIALFIDVIFQQAMLLILFFLFKDNQYLIYIFVLTFALSHLPIVFLDHLKKIGILIVFLCIPLGSLLFYFCYLRFGVTIYGLISGSIIHMIFYIIIMKYFDNKSIGIVV